MPDLQPSICTATVFPVSTTRLMATGPFVVDVSLTTLTCRKETTDYLSRSTGMVATPGFSPQIWA